MATTSTNRKILGIFSNCIDIVVHEHEPTKSVFEMIRLRMTKCAEMIEDKSHGEGIVVQTGSSYDGLHLSRMLRNSSGKYIFYPPIDFDFMMIYANYRILDRSAYAQAMVDLQDLLQKSAEFAVMVPASYPGYVKLAITKQGREMIKRPNCEFEDFLTKDGYLPNFVFKTKLFPEQYKNVKVLYQRETPKYTTSGPALSDFTPETDGHSFDFVHSFPCSSWPEIAINWTRRPRPTGWPSQELVKEVMTDGCAVVPVGHHLSHEADLEWRVSFNSAERKLSRSLTTKQRSCYSFVKFILKTGLRPSCILTSYHVKNLMFWYCEQMYGEGEWTDDLQGERIVKFLEYIANALANGSVPHYFLPKNNLIEHKTKTEIEQTRKEVLLVKDGLFHTVLLALSKLNVLEEVKGYTDKGELQNMLTVYTVFVQTLYKLGFMNLAYSLAERCFVNVVALNQCAKDYVRVASAAYSAQSVSELLKPFALAYTQAGEADNAIAVYEIMLRSEKSLVQAKYPETFTNLGCLYNLKYEKESQEDKKKDFIRKADENFKKALELINDSPSLHLAYGNFLLSSKKGVSSTIKQFEASLAIEHARADDEALIQISFPGNQGSKVQTTYVSGKVAAGYTLCDCLVKIDDLYEARRTANLLASIADSSSLRFRRDELLVCAMTYRRCGLYGKADLTTKESRKYEKVTQK